MKATRSIKLTRNDAEEVAHKLTVLTESPELVEEYGLTMEQAEELCRSVPASGGTWHVPQWGWDCVRSEMADHAVVLRDMSDDARSESIGQALRMARQAARFTRIFGRNNPES